jgi:hypothetical protein
MPEYIPKASDSIRDHGWTTIRICNETAFTLLFKEASLESGTFWQKPGSIGAFREMTFSACVWTKGEILSGANGSAYFTLRIPDDGEGYHEIDLSVGFGGGKAGTTKCFSDFSQKNATTRFSSDTVYALSDPLSVKTPDGSQTRLQFNLTSIPGEEARITIGQEFAERR